MNNNQIIGNNLKRIREERGLSVSQAADVCGVSKVILSQIERGDSNPTLNTIWKIAAGLQVHYTELLDLKENFSIVRKNEAYLQEEEDGAYRVISYFKNPMDRSFDFFVMELAPESHHASDGHPGATYESIIVESGRLSVETTGETVELQEGDAFCFRAASPHTYINRNAGGKTARCTLVINY